MPTLSIDQYKTLFAQAREELIEQHRLILAGNTQQKIVFSPQVDELLQFSKNYHARVIATQTLDSDPAELKQQVIADLEKILHNVTAVLDALSESPPIDFTGLNYEQANAVYNRRAGVCVELNTLNRTLQLTEVARGENGSQASWIPLQTLGTQSGDQLVSAISRAVPQPQEVDDDLGVLLAVFVRGGHGEPEFESMRESKRAQSLLQSYAILRSFVDDQSFREAIAATFAPLLGRLVQKQTIYAFDEDFRTMYFSTLNLIRKYYLEHPITAISEGNASQEQVREMPRALPSNPAPTESTKIRVGTGASQSTLSPAPAQPTASTPVAPPAAPVVPTQTQPPAPPPVPAQPIQPPAPQTPPRPPIKPIDLP